MGTYSYFEFCTLLVTVYQYSVYWDHPKKKNTALVLGRFIGSESEKRNLARIKKLNF